MINGYKLILAKTGVLRSKGKMEQIEEYLEKLLESKPYCYNMTLHMECQGISFNIMVYPENAITTLKGWKRKLKMEEIQRKLIHIELPEELPYDMKAVSLMKVDLTNKSKGYWVFIATNMESLMVLLNTFWDLCSRNPRPVKPVQQQPPDLVSDFPPLTSM